MDRARDAIVGRIDPVRRVSLYIVLRNQAMRRNVQERALRTGRAADIQWGLGWASWFVAGYCGLVIVMYLVRPYVTDRAPVVPLYVVFADLRFAAA